MTGVTTSKYKPQVTHRVLHRIFSNSPLPHTFRDDLEVNHGMLKLCITQFSPEIGLADTSGTPASAISSHSSTPLVQPVAAGPHLQVFVTAAAVGLAAFGLRFMAVKLQNALLGTWWIQRETQRGCGGSWKWLNSVMGKSHFH